MTASIGAWGLGESADVVQVTASPRLRTLQRGEQARIIRRTVVTNAVDEEGGGAVHPAAHSAQEVLTHPAGVHVVDHLRGEPVDVEAQSGSPGREVRDGEVLLVLERQRPLGHRFQARTMPWLTVGGDT